MKNGTIVHGSLVHRPCQTKITIYSPNNRDDRRAVVILQKAHNHPMPPSRKPSRDGIDAYKAAAVAMGVTGLTVVKLDRGTDY